MNIVLIGYRATGKTTLAALLVERLNIWKKSRSQYGTCGFDIGDTSESLGIAQVPENKNLNGDDTSNLVFTGTCDHTIPKRLRPYWTWTWVDTDQEVERTVGRTIAEIFADPTCGELAFRTMETEALREACSRDHCVIATGGGVPMREENRKILLQAVGKSSEKPDGWNAIVKPSDQRDESENRVEKWMDRTVVADGTGGFRTEVDKTRVENASDDKIENVFGDPNGKTSEATGLIVWLTATAETIHRRIRGDATSGERRPALTVVGTNDPLREIQTLLAKREPFYRQVADLELSTEDDSPEQLVEKIVRYVMEELK